VEAKTADEMISFMNSRLNY